MKTKKYSQIKIHSKNITKIEKYKKTKVQSIKELTHSQWSQKYTPRLRYTWKTLLKLTNTKKTDQQFYNGVPNTWTLLNTKN